MAWYCVTCIWYQNIFNYKIRIMKKISLFVFSLAMAFGLHSQQRQNQRMSAVYVTVNGNMNLQVSIDGTVYNLVGNGTMSKLNTPITNLAAGMHSLTLTKPANNNNNRRSNDITTQFNLRRNFDMHITVTANGALELIEKRKGSTQTGNTAMSSADFNMLMRDLRLQRTTQSKNAYLTTTFNQPNTYFSSIQVVQLLQQVRLESDRLPLAKLSFRTVADPNNFSPVYGLFSSQSNRSDLENYVNSYDGDLVVVDTDINGGMSETNFNNLYSSIKNEYSINTQVNSITTAFTEVGNRFTSSQASQLIQLINSENSRLYLAKLSYNKIIDPANFSTVSNLLYTQASRDELRMFITTGGVATNTEVRTAMTESEFNTLYQAANSQFLPYAKFNYLTSTFNNASYYFTTSQAKNLIQLVTNESNRLQLSKAVYRNLVDRGNYTQLFDLLASATSRTELTAYVQAYKD